MCSIIKNYNNNNSVISLNNRDIFRELLKLHDTGICKRLGISELLKKISWQLNPLSQNNDWGRDLRVVTPTRMHIIPRAFNLVEYEDILRAILSSDDTIQDSVLSGRGLQEISRAHAIRTAQISDIAYREARSCIEGGNCFMFQSPEGAIKAIVGKRSLDITRLALKEQHVFEEPVMQSRLQQIKNGIHNPSAESIRICRNEAIVDQRASQKEIEKLHKKMPTPISGHFFDLSRQSQMEIHSKKMSVPSDEDDYHLYYNEAIHYEAERELSRQIICEDLKTSVVAFVPQCGHCHIDTCMFVAPDGYTVCVDPSVNTSSMRQALQSIHCDVRPIQGIFPGSKTMFSMNLMNGIFASVSPPVFIVQDAPKGQEQNASTFFHQFQAIIPNGRVVPVPNTDSLVIRDGYIRCLTWEQPMRYQAIMDVVLRFLADEWTPRQKMHAIHALSRTHASSLFTFYGISSQ